MADEGKSIFDQAKEAGYEVVPKSDVESMRAGANDLKSLRAFFPEEYRGKEKDFFTKATEAFSRLTELESKGKTDLEKANTELTSTKGNLTKARNKITELETKLTATEREKKEALMHGHIMRAMISRNIMVHDKAIEMASGKTISDFPLENFNLNDPKSLEQFQETIFKDILQPAIKIQEEISGMAGSHRPKPEQVSKTGARKSQDDKAERLATFGSRA